MEAHKDKLGQLCHVRLDSGMIICSPSGHLDLRNRDPTRYLQLQHQAQSEKVLSAAETRTGWCREDLKRLMRFIISIIPTVNVSDAVLIQSVNIRDFRSIERDRNLGSQDQRYNVHRL